MGRIDGKVAFITGGARPCLPYPSIRGAEHNRDAHERDLAFDA
jgi:hypothetical protein